MIYSMTTRNSYRTSAEITRAAISLALFQARLMEGENSFRVRM